VCTEVPEDTAAGASDRNQKNGERSHHAILHQFCIIYLCVMKSYRIADAALCHSIVALIFCLCGTIAISQPVIHTSTHVDVPGSEPREHQVDMTRMVVDVHFVPEEGLVKGRVVHHFTVLQQSVDSILFDAIRITIRQATLGGKPVRFRSTDTSVIVYPEPKLQWDSQDSIAFTYEARPRKGLYFTGWNDTTGRMRKQIWTQGQGIDNRHWIPMYDEMNDKMLTETITTFASEYEVLSNGVKESVVVNGDGTRTWHYRMTKPHAGYLLMLGIGRYSITERTTKRGIPVRLYSYPELPDQIDPTYKLSTEMIDWLEEELGVPYPWESYSQIPVADFVFGAMENTTATVFGDFFLTDARGALDRSYFNVNVHELTHQWFGDYITGRSGKSIWLQESFATFYPYLYTGVLYGDDHLQWGRRGFHNAALSASEKDRLPIVHPSSGTARVYPKGAGVIAMMRYTFGEDETRRALRHYLRKHAFRNVQTSDLYLAFQDTLGITPDWFFDQWLYRGGEPHYRVSWLASSIGSQPTTRVLVAQTHHMDELVRTFKMPIVIEVHYKDGSKDSVRVWIDAVNSTIEIPNPSKKGIDFVLFDPGSYIMKKLTFPKPWSELIAQLKKAPLMIDRYDALVALGADTTRADERLAILAEVYGKERFAPMRVECIRQAGLIGGKAGIDLVRRGASDPDVSVRQASLGAFATIPMELRSDLEKLLLDSSYATVAMALSKLALNFPDQTGRYLDQTSRESGAHQRIRIARLELQAAAGLEHAQNELDDLCGPSWEFITRQNAMNAMKRIGKLSATAARNILDAAWSTNGRLAAVAQAVLTTLAESPVHKRTLRSVREGLQLESWKNDIIDPLVR
jgi:aminopeptidase N